MRRITNLNAFHSVEMPNSQKSVTEFPGKDSFKLLKVSVVCLEMSSDSKIIFEENFSELKHTIKPLRSEMISECRKSNDFTVCTSSKNLSREPSQGNSVQVSNCRVFSPLRTVTR